MAIDELVEQTHKVECQGKDKFGNKVLEKPVEAEVNIYSLRGNNMISSVVKCEYVGGCHNQKCKASYNRDVYCKYSFDLI